MACQSTLLTEISPQPYLCQVFLLSPCQKHIYIYLSVQSSACMKSSARSAPTLHSWKLYRSTSFDMSAGDTDDDDDGKHTRPTTMSSNDDIYKKLRPLTKYWFFRIACLIVHTTAYSQQAQNSCKFGKSPVLNSGIKVHKISASVLVLLDYLLRLHRRRTVSQHRLLTNTLFFGSATHKEPPIHIQLRNSCTVRWRKTIVPPTVCIRQCPKQLLHSLKISCR